LSGKVRRAEAIGSGAEAAFSADHQDKPGDREV